MKKQARFSNLVFKKVMERTGFYHKAKPTPGVFDAESLANNQELIEKQLKYGPVLDQANLGADAIFEISGSPCIYFKSIHDQTPFPADLARIHQVAWNHGLAPMLWVITTTEVLIFSCYSRPMRRDELDPSKHIIARFLTTDEGLDELNKFAGRIQIETGEIWKDARLGKIDRDKRVDRSLLKDLSEMQVKLAQAGLIPDVARSLLGRSILAMYLQDRKILGKEFFRKEYGVDDLCELLNDTKGTYKLFAWLDDMFHNAIFPLTYHAGRKQFHETDVVGPEHLEIVQKMFDGRRIKRGIKQSWLFKFDIIPVEFISSIYEMFIGNTSSVLSPHRSTHYTPLNLVDLVMENVSQRLIGDGNILDMSCGAGVFLVDAFRRLVARKIAGGQKWTRKLVRSTLHNQLFGLDVNPDSIQITAFCLYLTALELDPSPRSMKALEFEPMIGENLIAVDSFDVFAPFNMQEPFKSRNFAAIVGNPPWTRSKDKGLAWDYCRQHKYPLARADTPDQAFLWRIGRFASDDTVIGLILHASPFFSHAKPALKAKRALFNRFTTDLIVNLCEIRQDGLFPSSSAPGLVYIARGRQPIEGDTCKVVSCERVSRFKRHGIFNLREEQRKEISVLQAAEDPDILKIASWAGLGDIELVNQLRGNFMPLEKFCDQLYCRKGLNRGQGFQATKGNKDVPELIGQPWLQSGMLPEYLLNANSLPKVPKMSFYSPRNPGIYWAPLVITVRGLSHDEFKSAFCDRNVIYTEEYYGFSFSTSDSAYAHYLNGIFNSSLATYYLFLTASVWGVERDKIEPNDLMGLPIPDFNADNDKKIEKLLEAEADILEESKQSAVVPAKLLKKLDKAVFDLYGLSKSQCDLVSDFKNHTLDLKTQRENSLSLTPSTSKELSHYVEKFIETYLPEQTAGGVVYDIPDCPLDIVKILKDDASDISVETRDDINSVLEEILAELGTKRKSQMYPLVLRTLETKSSIYILKPSQKRYWTAAAAYNDAQAILTKGQVVIGGSQEKPYEFRLV